MLVAERGTSGSVFLQILLWMHGGKIYDIRMLFQLFDLHDTKSS